MTTDRAMTLIMAALHVSCGHVATARTYILALLDELCRFELLARSTGRLGRRCLATRLS